MLAAAVTSPSSVHQGRPRVSFPRRVSANRSSRVVARAKKNEDEDALPEPIRLTPNQARIAAIAFEVLYQKDPREDMEELLVDRERPELRAKLQRAIRAANEACKDGASAACAAAWEEVDGLEDAAMRVGMTQNAPDSVRSARSQKIPKINSAPSTSAPKKKENSSTWMSNPATMGGVDPLNGIMPCSGDTCEAPSGTFEARLRLERVLAGGATEAVEPKLTKAIRDAVDVAITLCENKADASQCAVAWEVVEELSSSASKRRVDDVEDKL